MQTAELVNDFLDFCEKRRNMRPLTVKTYRRTLEDFVQWTGPDGIRSSLEELGPDDVEDFGWRTTKRGLTPSPSTARKEMAALVQFLKWCAARRNVATTAHLSVVSPSIPDRQPRPIADDVWRRIWMSDLFVDDRLMLGDAYFLGRRRMEIVTTAPSAVDVGTQMLTFARKGGKTRSIEYAAVPAIQARSLPWLFEGWEDWVALLEATAAFRADEKHLSVFAEADDVFLDGNRLTKRLHAICAQVGVERFGPHRLRHSAATNLFRAGVPAEVVQNIMGHESFDTTTTYMSVAGFLQRKLEGAKQ